MREYPGPVYKLPTIAAAEAAEAAPCTEAAGLGGEVAEAVEAVEAAATGAGGAAFGSGAFIDIARLPWPGLTRSGFAFVTGCTGQPIFGRMGMMRAISSRKRVCCPMPGNGTTNVLEFEN